jgi:hypothetical protein
LQTAVKHIRIKPYTPQTNGKAERRQASLNKWSGSRRKEAATPWRRCDGGTAQSCPCIFDHAHSRVRQYHAAIVMIAEKSADMILQDAMKEIPIPISA